MSDEETDKTKTPLERAIDGYENLQVILLGVIDATTYILRRGDVDTALQVMSMVRSRIGGTPDDVTKH